MKYIHYIFVLVSVFLMISCAIQKTPSGGPVDKAAPVAIIEVPENESVNFNSGEIVISFDEYVTLKNQYKEILINPPLEENPDIKLKGKSLHIKFNSALKDSTTYSLQFGSAIADLTEGNVLTDYQYVFSTGDEIDSLILQGRVEDAFTKEAVENIKVVLYHADNDTGISSQKPMYFSRSNKNGEFSFKNIKHGRYQVFAIEDLNSNYYFDKGEKIGFIDEDIQMNKDSSGIVLSLFDSEEEEQGISGAEGIKPALCRVYFKNKVEKYRIADVSPEKAKTNVSMLNATRDSLFIWFNDDPGDSVSMIVKVDERIQDTLAIRMKTTPASKIQSLMLRKKDRLYALEQKLLIEAEEPIISIDYEKVEVFQDSQQVYCDSCLVRLASNPLSLEINLEMKTPYLYNMVLHPGAVKGISGRVNDSLFFSFQIKDSKDLGSISIQLQSTDSLKNTPLLLELLNSKDETVRQQSIKMKTSTKVGFNNLIPGQYVIRAIVDENENGYWDTGNFYKREQAEQIFLLWSENRPEGKLGNNGFKISYSF
jgi:uncharacterized protein (DUF2141 family)